MVPLGFISAPLGRRDHLGPPCRPYGGASTSVRGGAQSPSSGAAGPYPGATGAPTGP